jgi:hypothetical protein
MAEEDSNINNVNPVNGCASTQQERGSHSYRTNYVKQFPYVTKIEEFDS